MRDRTLINGQVVPEEAKPVQMTIETKCPQKWAFVDMETGDVWVHKTRLPVPNAKGLRGTFYSADVKANHNLVLIAKNLKLK
jgi:hypothetical protein